MRKIVRKGEARVKSKFFALAYVMNYIAQVAWSFALPAGLVIGVGCFLRWRFAMGDWVLITAIIFGVLCGVVSMFRYIIVASSIFDDHGGRRRRGGNNNNSGMDSDEK